MPRARVLACVVALAASACKDDAPRAGGDDSGTSSAGTESGSDTGEPTQAAACETATRTHPGIERGVIETDDDPRQGACGVQGPTTWLTLVLERRADLRLEARGDGYVPRVGAFVGPCTEEAWGSPTAVCGSGLPIWLLDVPAGAPVRVAVGVDRADPRLVGDETGTTGDTDGGVDPPEFQLALDLRRILEPGEACARGEVAVRCAPGTTCAEEPDDDSDGGGGEPRCVPVPGDVCENAVPIEVPASGTSVSIPIGTAFADDHHHACGGLRAPDAVYVLDLRELPQGSRIAASAIGPVRELAARGPGCALEDEIACAAAGTTLSFVRPPTGLVDDLFLFVELEQSPTAAEIELRLELPPP